MADLHRLAFTSAISIFAVIVLFFIVCVAGPIESMVSKGLLLSLVIIVLIHTSILQRHYPELDRSKLAIIKPSLFAGLGGITFTFVSQQTCFIIYRSLKEPSLKAWNWISHVTYFTAFLVCGSFAICGYLSFMEETDGGTQMRHSNETIDCIYISCTCYVDFLFVSIRCTKQLWDK